MFYNPIKVINLKESKYPIAKVSYNCETALFLEINADIGNAKSFCKAIFLRKQGLFLGIGSIH